MIYWVEDIIRSVAFAKIWLCCQTNPIFNVRAGEVFWFVCICTFDELVRIDVQVFVLSLRDGGNIKQIQIV